MSSMKKQSSLYLENAARERVYADDSRLEHVRAMHTRAALKWDELAARAERVERGVD